MVSTVDVPQRPPSPCLCRDVNAAHRGSRSIIAPPPSSLHRTHLAILVLAQSSSLGPLAVFPPLSPTFLVLPHHTLPRAPSRLPQQLTLAAPHAPAAHPMAPEDIAANFSSFLAKSQASGAPAAGAAVVQGRFIPLYPASKKTADYEDWEAPAYLRHRPEMTEREIEAVMVSLQSGGWGGEWGEQGAVGSAVWSLRVWSDVQLGCRSRRASATRLHQSRVAPLRSDQLLYLHSPPTSRSVL